MSALEDIHEQALSCCTKVKRCFEANSSGCSFAFSTGEVTALLEPLGSVNPSPNLNTVTRKKQKTPPECRCTAPLFDTEKAVLKELCVKISLAGNLDCTQTLVFLCK